MAGKQPWCTLIFLLGMFACMSAAVGIVRHALFTHGM
jgi:hypothetical protein